MELAAAVLVHTGGTNRFEGPSDGCRQRNSRPDPAGASRAGNTRDVVASLLLDGGGEAPQRWHIVVTCRPSPSGS